MVSPPVSLKRTATASVADRSFNEDFISMFEAIAAPLRICRARPGIEELLNLMPISSGDVIGADVPAALKRFESDAGDLGKLFGPFIGDVGIILGVEDQHLGRSDCAPVVPGIVE